MTIRGVEGFDGLVVVPPPDSLGVVDPEPDFDVVELEELEEEVLLDELAVVAAFALTSGANGLRALPPR